MFTPYGCKHPMQHVDEYVAIYLMVIQVSESDGWPCLGRSSGQALRWGRWCPGCSRSSLWYSPDWPRSPGCRQSFATSCSVLLWKWNLAENSKNSWNMLACFRQELTFILIKFIQNIRKCNVMIHFALLDWTPFIFYKYNTYMGIK